MARPSRRVFLQPSSPVFICLSGFVCSDPPQSDEEGNSQSGALFYSISVSLLESYVAFVFRVTRLHMVVAFLVVCDTVDSVVVTRTGVEKKMRKMLVTHVAFWTDWYHCRFADSRRCHSDAWRHSLFIHSR